MYTVYNTETGEIERLTSGGSVELPVIGENQAYVPGFYDGETIYFVDDEPTERPSMGISIDKTVGVADGEDLITVTGIPVGTSIKVTSMFVTLLNDTEDNGTLELGSEYPATMRVRLKMFPYVSESFEVTFNE